MNGPACGRVMVRAASLGALAALAITLNACSVSDNNQSANSAATTAAADAPARGGAEMIGYTRAMELVADDDLSATTGGDKAQIAEALEDVQVSIAAGKGLGVCHELSEQGELAVAESLGRTGIQACKDVISMTAERRRRAGAKSALSEILSIDVNGTTAVAHVEDPDGSTRYVPFVREGTAWRVTSLALVDDTVVENAPLGPGHDFSDPRGGGPAGDVKETLYDVQGDFPLGLGNSVCFELTAAGRDEIERSGIGAGDCEARLPTITRRALAGGMRPRRSTVLSVRADGRRAIVVVKDPHRPPYRVPFVKTAEGWKLPSLTLVEPLDLKRLR